MIEDPYVVLGLPRGASQDQIRAAYRRLAQIYHPDRYQGAPADVRAEAERRMKQVNAAYDALRKGTAASGPTTAPGPTTAGPRPGPEPRHPTAEEQARQEAVNFKGRFCSVCGHAPVANVTLKEGVGFVLFRQVRTVSGDLCRDCGIAMFREAQAGTLLKGWWGFIAFFANVLYVLQNAAARQALGRLAPPRRTPRSRLTPRSRPLVPGRPVWQRAGFLVSAGLAVVIVIGTVSNGSTGNGSTSSGAEPAPAAVTISSGECARVLGSSIYPVDCSDPSASLRVVAVLPATVDPQTGCPPIADAYSRRPGQVVCWQETG